MQRSQSRQCRSNRSPSPAPPLPHPDLLRQYEETLPGSGTLIVHVFERQVAMGEEQMRHRHELENLVVRGRLVNETRGQHYAFVLALGLLGASVWLLYLGKSIGGLSTLGATLTALIWSGVLGRKKQERELSAKRSVAEEARHGQ